MRAIDLSGQRFGSLVVIEFSGSEFIGNKRRRIWVCRCDCGRVTNIPADALRSGNSSACGRCRTASPTAFQPVHGASVDKTPTYKTWQSMRARVQRRKAYASVQMAPEWDDFSAFLRDMGERPDGMTIDRIENSRGYSKENCRWATPTQQTRNRRTTKFATVGERTMTLAEWAVELGITYNAALHRFRKYGTVVPPNDDIVRSLPP